MTEINTGGPAFPTYAGADWDKDPLDPNKDDPRNKILGGGMTLRDWFAGRALVGIINACAMDARQNGERTEEMFARKAYSVADAMLEARAKEASHDRT